MSYLPDPVEQGEMRAEAWAERLNMRDGMVDCYGCGKRMPVDESHAISADPWGPPACWDCCVKAWGRDPMDEQDTSKAEARK